MTDLSDPTVQELLKSPNHAVISTNNGDGSILSTVVWIDLINDVVTVNSAVGRRWPTNLERDPHITALVSDPENPGKFVEIRGTVQSSTDGADDDIDALAHKYLGVDEYPYRQPGEQRISFRIDPTRVRLINM
jgi:PPOX class probable F420-dependent enzyme